MIGDSFRKLWPNAYPIATIEDILPVKFLYTASNTKYPITMELHSFH